MISEEQLTKYTERARRHVELGRRLIEWQKEMVERHRAEGRDTKPAEDLLAALEQSQQVFERDLAQRVAPVQRNRNSSDL
jgi:coenzyme F420-reducing hydrogenase alpha subunit